ncbi:MAG: glycosyltransferase [Chthoniobacter sp.]|nr:glycosyltransferase [Chthoniobacter sp.]
MTLAPISFVIPLKDEEQTLRELFARIAAEMAALAKEYEVIFVDDGSTDGSWRIIQELARHHPAIVTACRFAGNSGKAQALAAGFQAARGEVVFTLDADLQDDPKEIPRFLAKLAEGFDIVSGWKRKRRDPWHKVLPSRVFNKMLSRFVGVALHDHNCGFKCYRRDVVKNVALYGEMHRMIPSLASIKGFRSAEIEVEHHARAHGVSKYGVNRFVRGFLDMQTVWFLKNFRERPLHFLGGSALALLLAGGLLGIVSCAPGLGDALAARIAALAQFVLALPIPLAALGFVAELLVHGIEEKGRRAMIAEIIPGARALAASVPVERLSGPGLRLLRVPSGPQVLIVDDDPDMRETLRLVLEDADFAVEEAADAAGALASLSEATAVVLLDMNLPTARDGFACLRQLRKRDADLKIVMVSGQQEIQAAVESMKMGACDYVVKPFDAARLVRAVQRAVELRRISEGDFEFASVRENSRPELVAV